MCLSCTSQGSVSFRAITFSSPPPTHACLHVLQIHVLQTWDSSKRWVTENMPVQASLRLPAPASGDDGLTTFNSPQPESSAKQTRLASRVCIVIHAFATKLFIVNFSTRY